MAQVTTLTQAQHARLDKLPDEYSGEPIVCGWHRNGGPIFRAGNTFKYVNKDGRVKPVSKEDRP